MYAPTGSHQMLCKVLMKTAAQLTAICALIALHSVAMNLFAVGSSAGNWTETATTRSAMESLADVVIPVHAVRLLLASYFVKTAIRALMLPADAMAAPGVHLPMGSLA